MVWPYPKNTWGHQNPEEAGESLPYRFQRGHNTANTLSLGLWPPACAALSQHPQSRISEVEVTQGPEKFWRECSSLRGCSEPSLLLPLHPCLHL